MAICGEYAKRHISDKNIICDKNFYIYVLNDLSLNDNAERETMIKKTPKQL